MFFVRKATFKRILHPSNMFANWSVSQKSPWSIVIIITGLIPYVYGISGGHINVNLLPVQRRQSSDLSSKIRHSCMLVLNYLC